MTHRWDSKSPDSLVEYLMAEANETKPPTVSATPASRATVLPGLDQALNGSSLAVPPIAQPVFSAVHSPSISEPLADLTAPLSALPASPPVAHKMPVVPESPPAASSSTPGLKNETARIAIMPEPKAATPRIQMLKPQRLLIAPPPAKPAAPLLIDPETSRDMVESIPVSLCWVLLGISALIFIIQLWVYFS
jgi:hypothetical protein